MWCSYPCDGLTEVSVSLANIPVDLEMQHDRYSTNEHEKCIDSSLLTYQLLKPFRFGPDVLERLTHVMSMNSQVMLTYINKHLTRLFWAKLRNYMHQSGAYARHHFLEVLHWTDRS